MPLNKTQETDYDNRLGLENSLSNIPIACYTIGENGNLVSWNEASSKLNPEINNKLKDFIPTAIELIGLEKRKYSSELGNKKINETDSLIIIHQDLSKIVDDISEQSFQAKRDNFDSNFNIASQEIKKELSPFLLFKNDKATENSVLDTFTDLMWELDENCNIVKINKAAKDAFDLAFQDINGTSFYDIIESKSVERITEKINLATKLNKNEIRFSCDFNSKTDGPKSFETVLNPIYNSQKKVTSFVGISREISTKEVNKLLDVLELKNVVLDLIAHDLRNSGNVICGISQFLLESQVDNEMYQLLKDCCDKMLTTLDDAINFSEIDNEEEISKKRIDLKSLLENCLTDFNSSIKKNQMIIQFDFLSTFSIWANPIISSVFENYIGNAIKHSNGSEKIVFSAYSVDGYDIIKVIDFGNTILEWDRKSVFERGIKLISGKKEGRGLGLSIVKKIVNAHNGEVWVEPNSPTGNCFCVKIPSAN